MKKLLKILLVVVLSFVLIPSVKAADKICNYNSFKLYVSSSGGYQKIELIDSFFPNMTLQNENYLRSNFYNSSKMYGNNTCPHISYFIDANKVYAYYDNNGNDNCKANSNGKECYGAYYSGVTSQSSSSPNQNETSVGQVCEYEDFKVYIDANGKYQNIAIKESSMNVNTSDVIQNKSKLSTNFNNSNKVNNGKCSNLIYAKYENQMRVYFDWNSCVQDVEAYYCKYSNFQKLVDQSSSENPTITPNPANDKFSGICTYKITSSIFDSSEAEITIKDGYYSKVNLTNEDMTVASDYYLKYNLQGMQIYYNGCPEKIYTKIENNKVTFCSSTDSTCKNVSLSEVIEIPEEDYDNIFNPIDNSGSMTCVELLGGENSKGVKLLRGLFLLMKIAAPIIFIALSTLDFVGALTSDNPEAERNKAFRHMVIRAVACILLFMLPYLVKLIFAIVGVIETDTCGVW